MQKVKNRSGCNCCDTCGTIDVTVRTCTGDALVSGAVVTVYDDADVEVDSGTTGGTGIVSVAISAAGDYTIVVTKAGEVTATIVVSATCTTNTITVRLGRVINVTVRGCRNISAGNLPGVTVTATLGANTYSAVTDGSGVAAIWVPVNGIYAIAIAAFGRYSAYSSSATVSSCAAASYSAILGAASGYMCCEAPTPSVANLYLTDNAGTTPLVVGGGFLGNLGGSATLTVPSGLLTGPGSCGTVVGPITIRIDYNFVCDSGALVRRVTTCQTSFFFDTTVNILRDKDDVAVLSSAVTANFPSENPTSIAYVPYSATYAAFNRNGVNLGTTSVTE